MFMDNNVVAAEVGELGSCDRLDRVGCGYHIRVVQSDVLVRLPKDRSTTASNCCTTVDCRLPGRLGC